MRFITSLQSKINYEKTYYYSFIIFAFTLPLSRAMISFYEIFFVLFWLFEGKFQEKFQFIKHSKPLNAILLFLVFQFFTFAYSQDKYEALAIMQDYLYWLLIFVFASKIQKTHIRSIVSAFLYGMFVSEVLAYIIFFDIYPFHGRPPSYPSPFMMHIDYSVYLAFTSILLLNRLFSSIYSYRDKLLLFLFFLTVTINLFISTGRTGQLAYLVALFVLMIIKYRVSLKSLIIFSLLSFSIFFGAYKALPIFQERVDFAKSDIIKLKQQDFNTSWGLRAAFWIITYKSMQDNFFLGVGIGDHKIEAKRVMLENLNLNFDKNTIEHCSTTHYHNQYLMVLVQSGIIGLMLMLYLLYQIYKIKIEEDELRNIKILFLTIFLVAFIAEPLWMKQFTAALFVLFVGIFIAVDKNQTTIKT
ncbi:hypothetical protein GJV85_04155 [Sulfurimonas aquatica]|uniref:O-antigen ligase-related domain-containing protein n=1 Tax=Sulfurimonas aquatica TaxID=2672570 RepID=A0A975GC76_9BACT|nr:O-antigen ligase family protein [Sulfurimonas aquatica]QSZ41330.1 hypothetical protein GJV85_04155 [Sulfurimonas aquatica]